MASGDRPWENDGINYVYEVSKEQLASLQRAHTESGGGGEAEWSDEEDGGSRPLTPEDLWSEKHILDAAQLALKDHETKTGQKLNLYNTVVCTCPMYNRLHITGKLFPEARKQKAAKLV